MDDASTTRLRKVSKRKQRWSMNSQRLEEIVAELMKPISDVRRSFDTDLSALLEEYLTEAGLHALAAEERGAAPAVPNFAELALLLQQSASIYSRKVDFLYQHVLSVSDSLQQSTQEIHDATGAAHATGAAEAEAEAASPAGARRKRKSSATPPGFAALTLEGDAAPRREAALRPPPTLPRMFVELEPRAPCDADAPLCDYAGEPVGLLADFHVAWRLQNGFLVEELSGAQQGVAALRAVPLGELSAAIAAAAPPSPPHPPDPRSPDAPSPPPRRRSPTPPAAASTPLPDAPRRERKRRSESRPEDAPDAGVRLAVTPAVRRRLQTEREFCVPATWLRRVARARTRAVLEHRRLLRAQPDDEKEFRGFDVSDSADVGGFAGWSSADVEAAAAATTATTAATTVATTAVRRTDDSDDDGFFEQSSLGDSDSSAATPISSGGGAPEWMSWRARVVERAAAGEARGRDVRRAAAAVLAACGRLPSPAPFPALLARAAAEPPDVSELFLATLFLANAGNVEIVAGPPLTVDSFGVRLLSDDQRLYRALTAPECAQGAARDGSGRAQGAARDGSGRAQGAARDGSGRAQGAASDGSGRAQGAASDGSGRDGGTTGGD